MDKNEICGYFSRMLWDMASGEISPDDKKALTEHLLSCENCRRELDECRRILDAEKSVLQAPEELHDRVFERIRADAKKKKTAQRLKYVRWASGVAAALVVAVGVYAALRLTGVMGVRSDADMYDMDAIDNGLSDVIKKEQKDIECDAAEKAEPAEPTEDSAWDGVEDDDNVPCEPQEDGEGDQRAVSEDAACATSNGRIVTVICDDENTAERIAEKLVANAPFDGEYPRMKILYDDEVLDLVLSLIEEYDSVKVEVESCPSEYIYVYLK